MDAQATPLRPTIYATFPVLSDRQIEAILQDRGLVRFVRFEQVPGAPEMTSVRAYFRDVRGEAPTPDLSMTMRVSNEGLLLCALHSAVARDTLSELAKAVGGILITRTADKSKEADVEVFDAPPSAAAGSAPVDRYAGAVPSRNLLKTLVGFREVRTRMQAMDILKGEGIDFDMVYTGDEGPPPVAEYFNAGRINVATWSLETGALMILRRHDPEIDRRVATGTYKVVWRQDDPQPAEPLPSPAPAM